MSVSGGDIVGITELYQSVVQTNDFLLLVSLLFLLFLFVYITRRFD